MNLIFGASKTSHFLVVQKGERFLESLTQYCKQAKIDSGCLWALGGLEHAVIKVINSYEPVIYDEEELDGPLELVSAFGNIAMKDEEIVLHVHGTISKDRCEVMRTGHLGECLANPFIECYIQPLDIQLKREFDPKLQVNKLVF